MQEHEETRYEIYQSEGNDLGVHDFEVQIWCSCGEISYGNAWDKHEARFLAARERHDHLVKVLDGE